jgi:hypothetical protein
MPIPPFQGRDSLVDSDPVALPPAIEFVRCAEIARIARSADSPHGPNRRRYSGDSMKPRTIVFSRKSGSEVRLNRLLWKMYPH